MNNLAKLSVLDVSLTNASKDTILKYVRESIVTGTKKYYLVTPNPEMLVRAQKDTACKEILNKAELSLVDGVGLVAAAKILGKGRLERFPGVDFIQEVCALHEEKPIKLGFLGGRKGVAEKTVECLLETYPGLHISFVCEEWTEQGFQNAQHIMETHRQAAALHGNEKTSVETSSGFIPESKKPQEAGFGEKIDLLFVAFGFPKQEFWIAEHLSKIPVKIAIGVGGAFDYLSKEVPRAPRWAQAWGMEWLFRLVRQPWRLKRQLALLTFMRLVLAEKFSSHR